MKIRIQNNIEVFNTMIELLGTSKQEISDFVQSQRKEISKINKAIKQVHLAERMLTKYFSFLDNEKDRQQIIKICQKFPEIRTARQVEVIFYLVKGLSAQEIADQMRTCEKTVKFHKTNIYKATMVKSQIDLLAYFFDNKMQRSQKDSLPLGSVQQY